MAKRNNDLFEDWDDTPSSEEYKQANRVEETVPSTPSSPSVSSSMEDKQMMQSLALLKEVQEVIRKTGLAQEDAAELVRKLWSSMNGIKDFGEEICKTNSEVRKSLENLNYQMSEKSEEYIAKQFGALRNSFLQDTTAGLREIKKEFLDGLATDSKRIVSEAQASLDKAQKKIDKSQEGKGYFISMGMLIYLTLLCFSSVAIGSIGMENIVSRVNKEDLMTAKTWYCFCLASPWIWWGLKLFWNKVISRE